VRHASAGYQKLWFCEAPKSLKRSAIQSHYSDNRAESARSRDQGTLVCKIGRRDSCLITPMPTELSNLKVSAFNKQGTKVPAGDLGQSPFFEKTGCAPPGLMKDQMCQ